MPRSPVKIKKHLDFTALRQCFSEHLESVDDHRLKGRCTHSLHDAFMSGFACMFFQDPSLTQFQKRLDEAENSSNLRTLFKMTTMPEAIANTDGADKQDCEINEAKRYLKRLKIDHPRIIIVGDGL